MKTSGWFTVGVTCLVSWGASACRTSGPDQGALLKEDPGVAGGTTTIIFPGDFSQPRVSGTLAPGAAVTILWDEARYQAFNICGEGAERCGINVDWNVDGGPALNRGGVSYLEPVTRDGQTYARMTLTTPAQGRDWGVWFSVATRHGRLAYDSNSGSNYHFALGGAAPGTQGARLVFSGPAGSDPVLTGRLVRGGTLTIMYDEARFADFTSCGSWGRSKCFANPKWSVDGGAVSDHTGGGGTVVTVDGRPWQSLAVRIPAQGQDWALWFMVTNGYGQVNWDSKSGANYHFQLAD